VGKSKDTREINISAQKYDKIDNDSISEKPEGSDKSDTQPHIDLSMVNDTPKRRVTMNNSESIKISKRNRNGSSKNMNKNKFSQKSANNLDNILEEDDEYGTIFLIVFLRY
jgi:hypothetical protein